MSTMYEVNWHCENDKFSHCTVTPIAVLREGILPGCSAVSITARDASGRKFHGSPGDYFKTKESAWEHVKEHLLQTVLSNDKTIETLKDESFRMHKYLCGLAEELK